MFYNPLILLAAEEREKDGHDSRTTQLEQYNGYYGTEVRKLPTLFTPFVSPRETGMMLADLVIMPIFYVGIGLYVIAIGISEITNGEITDGLGTIGIGLFITAIVTPMVEIAVFLSLTARLISTCANVVSSCFSQNDEQAQDTSSQLSPQ